jgi:hypothetical protein
VQHDKQESRDAVRAGLQGRLEVRDVQDPAATAEVEPQPGGRVPVLFVVAVARDGRVLDLGQDQARPELLAPGIKCRQVIC